MTISISVVASRITGLDMLRKTILAQWDNAASAYATVLGDNIVGSYQATTDLWPDNPDFRMQRFNFWLQRYPQSVKFLSSGRAFTTDNDLYLIVPYRNITATLSIRDVAEYSKEGIIKRTEPGFTECVIGIRQNLMSGSCTIIWADNSKDRLAWVRVPPPDTLPWRDNQYYYAFVGYLEADAIEEVDEFSKTNAIILVIQAIAVVIGLYTIIWISNYRRQDG